MLTPHDNTILDALENIAARLGGVDGSSARAVVRGRLLKILHSQELDPDRQGVQLGIQCRGSFVPSDWNTPLLPMVTGQEKAYSNFQPELLSATATVTGVFRNGPKEARKSIIDQDAGDGKLVMAFVGARNVFPAAPNQDLAVSLISFQRMCIDWPTVYSGLQISMSCALERTILDRVPPHAGFKASDLVHIDVTISIDLFGSLC